MGIKHDGPHRNHQKPSIEEVQTIPWPNIDIYNTTYTQRTKDWATRTTLKTGERANLCEPEG